MGRMMAEPRRERAAEVAGGKSAHRILYTGDVADLEALCSFFPALRVFSICTGTHAALPNSTSAVLNSST
jgi:hypothetical protein